MFGNETRGSRRTGVPPGDFALPQRLDVLLQQRSRLLLQTKPPANTTNIRTARKTNLAVRKQMTNCFGATRVDAARVGRRQFRQTIQIRRVRRETRPLKTPRHAKTLAVAECRVSDTVRVCRAQSATRLASQCLDTKQNSSQHQHPHRTTPLRTEATADRKLQLRQCARRRHHRSERVNP